MPIINATSSTVTHGTGDNVILKDAMFKDELLTSTAAATYLEGTILARDSGTGKMVPYVKGGVTTGNGVPKAVLTYQVQVDGAGDVAIRAAITGKFRKQRMIIHADKTGANIDNAVLDALRDYDLVAIDVRP